MSLLRGLKVSSPQSLITASTLLGPSDKISELPGYPITWLRNYSSAIPTLCNCKTQLVSSPPSYLSSKANLGTSNYAAARIMLLKTRRKHKLKVQKSTK